MNHEVTKRGRRSGGGGGEEVSLELNHCLERFFISISILSLKLFGAKEGLSTAGKSC